MTTANFYEDVFGENGYLAKASSNYEVRPGQMRIAQAIGDAILKGKHLFCEAPCGTGKSFAHCVPAIHHTEHPTSSPIVIATANIALQEQLINKDLPFLTTVLPQTFTFALLKGRSRYLCQWASRHKKVSRRLSKEELEQVAKIEDWKRVTKAGDISELPFVASPSVWERFSTTADDCRGSTCPYLLNCFAEQARKVAFASRIIVVNFHLLFAHLSVRAELNKNIVLPHCDCMILDEAHEAADTAREFFGFYLNEWSFSAFVQYAVDQGRIPLAKVIEYEAKTFFREVAKHAKSPEYKCRLRKVVFTQQDKLLGALDEIVSLAAQIQEEKGAAKEDITEAKSITRHAKRAASQLREVVQLSDANRAYYIEVSQLGHAKIVANVVDVSGVLGRELFGKAKTVVMMSATMTVGGSFGFVRREVGAPNDALEIAVKSPFAIDRQALLVTPKGPEPRDPRFTQHVADVLKKVIDVCKGRTLGLFTSNENLNAVSDIVRSWCRYRVLKQNDMPRNTLAKIFREDTSSVLLGTNSFWTGIDVPGEALTAVVIDKIPFPNMNDPVINVLCERDPDAFVKHLLPRAVITLRQGVGRLVRSKKDVGVVIVCDSRITGGKSYARVMIQSLAPMQSTDSLDDIFYFLSGMVRPCNGRFQAVINGRFLGAYPTARKAASVCQAATSKR